MRITPSVVSIKTKSGKDITPDPFVLKWDYYPIPALTKYQRRHKKAQASDSFEAPGFYFGEVSDYELDYAAIAASMLE